MADDNYTNVFKIKTFCLKSLPSILSAVTPVEGRLVPVKIMIMLLLHFFYLNYFVDYFRFSGVKCHLLKFGKAGYSSMKTKVKHIIEYKAHK